MLRIAFILGIDGSTELLLFNDKRIVKRTPSFRSKASSKRQSKNAGPNSITLYQTMMAYTTNTGVSCVLGADTPHKLCDDIARIDCSTGYVPNEADERVCGSDGVTYNNFCEYSQARCKTPQTHISRIGDCSAPTTPTTQAPVTTKSVTTGSQMVTGTTPPSVGVTGTTPPSVGVTGTTPPSGGATTVDTVLQVFCASKDAFNCPSKLEPVCGSDKNFYLNQCEFTKTVCDNPGLTSQPTSFCSGARK